MESIMIPNEDNTNYDDDFMNNDPIATRRYEDAISAVSYIQRRGDH